jgi:DUF4097 and DUF4098 domain-containing protein YvlB
MLSTACVILMALFPSASAQSDEWSKTYNLERMPTLRVETSDANITVTGWDNGSIAAKVSTTGWKIGGDGITIVESQTGDQIDIQVKFPHRMFQMNLRNHRVDIDIKVPRQANLDLHTGDGHVDLQGVRGNIALRSGDGHLRLSEIQGTLDARTGDGHIDAANIRGDLTLHTGDGPVVVSGADGSLHAQTGDGHMRVSGRFDLLDVKTGDGGIDATAQSGSKLDADWRLTTGDGDLTLRLPEGLAANVEMHTNDGHINLGMPLTISGRTGTKELHGQLNGGGKVLSLHTGDGSIHLEKN